MFFSPQIFTCVFAFYNKAQDKEKLNAGAGPSKRIPVKTCNPMLHAYMGFN